MTLKHKTLSSGSMLSYIEADEGKQIRDINDVYVPEHTDPETGEIIPEHIPHYSEKVYVPNTYTEEMMYENWVEEFPSNRDQK